MFRKKQFSYLLGSKLCMDTLIQVTVCRGSVNLTSDMLLEKNWLCQTRSEK